MLAIAAPSLPATVALFALAWIPIGISNVVFVAFVQSAVPDDLVGRVVSLATSASAAAMPVGGAGGDVVGPTAVVAALGAAFFCLSGYWLVNPLLKRFPAVDRIDPEAFGLVRATE